MLRKFVLVAVAAASLGAGLAGAAAPASAEYWGGPRYGYDRGYGRRPGSSASGCGAATITTISVGRPITARASTTPMAVPARTVRAGRQSGALPALE
jgi:hypothetical protein